MCWWGAIMAEELNVMQSGELLPLLLRFLSLEDALACRAVSTGWAAVLCGEACCAFLYHKFVQSRNAHAHQERRGLLLAGQGAVWRNLLSKGLQSSLRDAMHHNFDVAMLRLCRRTTQEEALRNPVDVSIGLQRGSFHALLVWMCSYNPKEVLLTGAWLEENMTTVSTSAHKALLSGCLDTLELAIACRAHVRKQADLENDMPVEDFFKCAAAKQFPPEFVGEALRHFKVGETPGLLRKMLRSLSSDRSFSLPTSTLGLFASETLLAVPDLRYGCSTADDAARVRGHLGPQCYTEEFVRMLVRTDQGVLLDAIVSGLKESKCELIHADVCLRMLVGGFIASALTIIDMYAAQWSASEVGAVLSAIVVHACDTSMGVQKFETGQDRLLQDILAAVRILLPYARHKLKTPCLGFEPVWAVAIRMHANTYTTSSHTYYVLQTLLDYPAVKDAIARETNASRPIILRALECDYGTFEKVLACGNEGVLKTKDDKGNNAWHYVAKRLGPVSLFVNTLFESRVPLEANYQGVTPLEVACSKGRRWAVVALLELFGTGAMLNSFVSCAPIRYPIRMGDVPLLKLFLKYGAQISLPASGGDHTRFLNMAAEHADPYMVSLLMAQPSVDDNQKRVFAEWVESNIGKLSPDVVRLARQMTLDIAESND